MYVVLEMYLHCNGSLPSSEEVLLCDDSVSFEEVKKNHVTCTQMTFVWLSTNKITQTLFTLGFLFLVKSLYF